MRFSVPGSRPLTGAGCIVDEMPDTMQSRSGWRAAAVRACAAAGAVLGCLAAAGCAGPAAGRRPATVESCIRFGISALRDHAAVVSVPAACRGLSRAQVNFAVGSALHIMSATGHGKASQRERAVRLSPLLADLVAGVTGVTGQPGPPEAGSAVHAAGGISAGVAALASWLVTVTLGISMLIRRIVRSGPRGLRAGPGRRLPPLALGHLGLAVTGLLAWAAYLATGLTGAGWAACALLLPVTGLGMTLSIPGPAVSPVPAVPSGPGLVASRPLSSPPALVIAVHAAFAVLTIMFVLLAVTGAG